MNNSPIYTQWFRKEYGEVVYYFKDRWLSEAFYQCWYGHKLLSKTDEYYGRIIIQYVSKKDAPKEHNVNECPITLNFINEKLSSTNFLVRSFELDWLMAHAKYRAFRNIPDIKTKRLIPPYTSELKSALSLWDGEYSGNSTNPVEICKEYINYLKEQDAVSIFVNNESEFKIELE